MKEKHSEEHLVDYGTYFLIWISLLLLTVITVVVSLMELGNLSVLTAVLIASVKATLVLSVFMHLKYEKRIFKVMFFVAIITLGIFIGMTFTDILFR